jgi:hypothetical protein
MSCTIFSQSYAQMITILRHTVKFHKLTITHNSEAINKCTSYFSMQCNVRVKCFFPTI